MIIKRLKKYKQVVIKQETRIHTETCYFALNVEMNSTDKEMKYNNWVRAGFGQFWKVMEIEKDIFQDLESFGNERVPR